MASESLPSSDPAPVVRQNLWKEAASELPAGWKPWRTVSIVIPNYNNSATLDLTMASLAAQDYPADLFDVVVVDDGSTDCYTLPEICPANARVITPEAGWGRANACATGARATAGEIILWLDSDMIVAADHVRQHLQWYDRLADVVTKGEIHFIADWTVTPLEVRDGVADGSIGGRLEADGFTRQWVETRYESTDELNTSREDVFSIWTGATASISREMYERAGGMDVGLRLGEDSELAYRLWNAGAVFIPARDALSWHLGATNTQKRNDVVTRHDRPYFAQRAPMLHAKRAGAKRTWEVPLVHAVVTADIDDVEMAGRAVDALLASKEHDIRVDFVAPWDAMHERRRRVLDDAGASLYWTHEWFRGEPRVRLVTTAPESVHPAAFRLDVPRRAGLAPQTLGLMLAEMRRGHHGVLRVPFDAVGESVDLWRTAALERARRHQQPDEDLQRAVDRVWGIWWAQPEAFPFADLAAAEVVPASPTAAETAALPSRHPEPTHPSGDLDNMRKELARVKKTVKVLRAEQAARQGIKGSLRAIRSDVRSLARSIRRRLKRPTQSGRK